MKMSISNLAFLESSLEEILPRLSELNIRGVEVAPTRLWPDPLESTPEERASMAKKIKAHDVSVVGLQSLFYNRPELRLFSDAGTRKNCLRHLTGMIDLCADLGGELIVFGAAGTRRRDERDIKEAQKIAADFFLAAAEHGQKRNIYICFEPLAPAYKCDFINTIAEGAGFIREINHPHLRLVIDTGNMFLNGEDPLEQIKKYIGITRHIHINNPQLTPAGGQEFPHEEIARAVKESGYQGWLTMEFLAKDKLAENVAYSLRTYQT